MDYKRESPEVWVGRSRILKMDCTILVVIVSLFRLFPCRELVEDRADELGRVLIAS